MNSYESAVAQLLARRINEVIGERLVVLEDAQFVDPSNPNATAYTYIRETSYLRGLRDALDFVKQVEIDLQKAG